MRTAIYFFYGLDVEIRPKSGVPHHPPELFIHLGGAIGNDLTIFLGAPIGSYLPGLGSCPGVMAQDVVKTNPMAVHIQNGLLYVDYSKLDVDMELVS